MVIFFFHNILIPDFNLTSHENITIFVKDKEVFMALFESYDEAILSMVDGDPQLKKDFIADPKKFIHDKLKIQLPNEMEIKVVEDKENVKHYIIPYTEDEEGIGIY